MSAARLSANDMLLAADVWAEIFRTFATRLDQITRWVHFGHAGLGDIEFEIRITKLDGAPVSRDLVARLQQLGVEPVQVVGGAGDAAH